MHLLRCRFSISQYPLRCHIHGALAMHFQQKFKFFIKFLTGSGFYLSRIKFKYQFKMLHEKTIFLFHTDFHRLCQTILHLFAFVLCLLHFMYFTITSAPPDELRNHLPVAQMSLYPPSDSVFLLSISSDTHEIQYCLLL